MRFKQFLLEGSIQELYVSTVKAFPKTTKRQNSIDTIRIVKLEWIPYLDFKTLYIKGLAQNIENSKEYMPIIVFKNIKYMDEKSKNTVQIVDKNNKKHIIEKIDHNNKALVRCNCKDFFWRGNYPNHLDKSLYGKKRKPYSAVGTGKAANPKNDPMLCKHIIKLHKVLEQSGITY